MLHETKGLNMLKTVNCTEYLKNKLSIKSIFSWLNGRAVEQLNSSISVKFFNLSTIKLKNLFTTHYSKFTKKLFAFTLAETLIVMGVIGVVAALTLPNLNQSTNNKEKVAKVKKIYQNLNDAFGRAVAVYGPMDEWCTGLTSDNCKKRRFERITEFMKLSKVCGNSGDSCPAGAETLFLNADDTYPGPCWNGYCAILADGTVVDLVYAGNIIEIDIDGLNKGAHTYGKDIFVFDYDINGIRPSVGGPGQCFKFGLCSEWVIMNDNMDYLKADENGKCKNSNVTLSETATSCN